MSSQIHHSPFEAPQPEHLADLFPSYVIHRLIACGGMGAVYHATQLSLDREVAIKILPREFTDNDAFRAGFEAEAKSMAKLNHPNLVSVYDFGEADRMLYIIMEYVAGKSLYHSAHGHAVDPAEAIRITIDIARGLSHAHHHGILHRDIKPSNILLDAQVSPKIGDFGLARHEEIQTQEGDEIFGTPGYTAPEAVRPPFIIDHRADIFSLGVLLHELLTGKLPEADPRPASQIARTDPRLDAVIRRACNPNPALRHKGADEFAGELEKISRTALRTIMSGNTGNVRNSSPAPKKHQALKEIRRPEPAAPGNFVRQSGARISPVRTGGTQLRPSGIPGTPRPPIRRKTIANETPPGIWPIIVFLIIGILVAFIIVRNSSESANSVPQPVPERLLPGQNPPDGTLTPP